MCRNIKILYNFSPPTKANAAVIDQAVDEVYAATQRLLGGLVTAAPPRDRELDAARRRAKSAERFGRVA
jgi:hypothetical protein